MRRGAAIAVMLLYLGGCGGQEELASLKAGPNTIARAVADDSSTAPTTSTTPLVQARRGFTTRLAGRPTEREPVPVPPPAVFRLVHFDSAVGKLAAYLTPDPGDGRKRPAIVWITGGDCNSVGDVWSPKPREHDQSAAAYRKAGIVMMFPSLRGGNDNPGRHEAFLGEVDDVLAAVEFLGRQDSVDPSRIYLGGHSTGGTLVMLVAASTDRLRAVFSFGPADDVGGYPSAYIPFDTSNPKEIEIRSPGRWLDSVRCPLFVLEGTGSPGNIGSLRKMAAASTNARIRFLPVDGVNHFNILGPANDLIAAKILADDGPTTRIAFTEEELNGIGRK